MATVADMPSEKPAQDVEAVNGAPIDATAMILEPLLFLLAARRGLRSDPAFEALNVPDDRIMTYLGKAGVEIFNKKSLRDKIIAVFGNFANSWVILPFSLFNFLFMAFDYSQSEKKDPLERHAGHRYAMKISMMITAIVMLLCFAAKKYTMKRVAESTPPQFDPSSYQCRLMQAMDQRGLYYRGIVTNSWEQMESIWKTDRNVAERISIKGLVDPGSSWVYDINVRLWNSGNLIAQFAPKEENSQTPKPGVIIKSNA